MSLFTSSREKRLWFYAFLVLAAIISTLIWGGRLALTIDQSLKDALFFYTIIALAATVLLHGLLTRPGKVEITILVGLSAIFILLYSRLGFAERGHLFEYSVLAIFIHKALMERVFQGRKIPRPALLAFLIAFAVGAFDEFIQLFLPSRVFDIIDILFNGFAAFAAIGASSAIRWVRELISKDK